MPPRPPTTTQAHTTHLPPSPTGRSSDPSAGHVHFAGTVAAPGGAGTDTVEVFNGPTSLGLATVTAGNWSLDTNLAAGTYSALKVVATDLAGNATTATNAQSIVVDQTAPSDSFATLTLTLDIGTAHA